MTTTNEPERPQLYEVVWGDAHGITLKRCASRHANVFCWEASAMVPVPNGGRMFRVQSDTAPGALSGLRDALECMILTKQLKEPSEP